MHSPNPAAPALAPVISEPDRAFAALEAELARMVEPCPLCDLSSVGPCPACDGRGWIALESPVAR